MWEVSLNSTVEQGHMAYAVLIESRWGCCFSFVVSLSDGLALFLDAG